MDQYQYNPMTGEMDIVGDGGGVIVVGPTWGTLDSTEQNI